MNIREAWSFGRFQLAHTSPTPELDARLLLEFVLQVSHSHLLAHGEEALTAEEESRYRDLIRRAAQKEPIPYLTGSAPFFGLDFEVTPAVLIPRPGTELVVELALEWAGRHEVHHAVDVGTGSGCIAVMLARCIPEARVTAVDISTAALQIARRNGRRHAPGRICFRQGDLLQPLDETVDLIVANLPYIAESEWTLVDDGVKWYEPAGALQGGADGLDLIKALLQQAAGKLNPAGAIFLEIGWQQGPAARAVAQRRFPAANVEVIADHAGHDRIVAIR